MSDISIPTGGGGQPAPQNEVTIPEVGPSGGDTGGQVGQQTPQKTPEQIAWDRAADRREAIERAFEKTKGQAEERAAAKEQDKKSDEQARPRQQQAQERKLQERGERGRFASQQQPGQQGQQGQIGQQGQQQRYAPLAENAPYRDAPARFSDAAKADWHGVPESVRGATTQALRQYEQGFAQHRAAAEAFGQVADYHQLATQHGTNLRAALGNYVGMETLLRRDFTAGVDLLLSNLQQGQQGKKITLQDFARHILRLTPEQHRLTQAQNTAQAQHHQLGQMHQTVSALANTVNQMQYQAHFSATRSQIDRFAETHPRFDELGELIKQELDHGYPLDQAYERAVRLGPAPGRGNGSAHAAQTRNTSAQTRTAEIDRSISGAPNGSTQASTRDTRKKVSSREALANAMRRVKSGV